MAIKPMYDMILVKPIKAVEKTASGIVLVNQDITQNYAEGIVEAIGEGYKNSGADNLIIVPLKVKVGDTVL